MVTARVNQQHLTKPINICQVAPMGYVHSSAFNEIVETLVGGFQALGLEVTAGRNTVSDKSNNIIVGANLLSESECDALGRSNIVYNLEQIDGSSTWLTTHYKNLLSRVRVLDYSEKNAEHLRLLTGNDNVRVLPVSFWSGLTRISPAPIEDIDVLFYGSMNDRRKAIIDALRAKGFVVAVAFGLYGAKRDELIARAKLILNLHYYESSIFEVVRVSYLLANRKAVVAERGSNTDVYPWLERACAWSEYESLVGTVESLLTDPEARGELAKMGMQGFLGHPIEEFLGPLIGFIEKFDD